MRAGTGFWVGVAVGLGAAAALGSLAPREALQWHRALLIAEPWRLWTAAFSHLSALHLIANELGCVVVAAFGVGARVPVPAALAWLAAWPLGHAALAVEPALVSYAGLSGVLHAGVMVAAWHLLRREAGRRRLIGAFVLLGVTVKLLLEQPWAGATRSLPGWDFDIAPVAHATGAIAGLACAVIADAWAHRRNPK
jgi:rhomboid family GlyGly-CTERM serine protease